MSSTKPAVAYRLRMLRKALNQTQETLASRMDGISRSTIANVESGRQYPSRALIDELCLHFPVNAFWLLYGTGDMWRADQLDLDGWKTANQLALMELRDPESPPPPDPEPAGKHAERAWLIWDAEHNEAQDRTGTVATVAAQLSEDAFEREIEKRARISGQEAFKRVFDAVQELGAQKLLDFDQIKEIITYGFLARADKDEIKQVIMNTLGTAQSAPTPKPPASPAARTVDDLVQSAQSGSQHEVRIPVPKGAGIDPQVAEMVGAVLLDQLYRRGIKVTTPKFHALCRAAFALPHPPGMPPAPDAISHLIEQELARDGLQSS